MSEQIGTALWELPGYRVGQLIGRGGFAAVYEAEQLSLGRPVAVKVLMTDLAAESDRRRFDRERSILARLGEHPSVVDVYDAGISAEHRPFLVMRLYRRGTLATRLAQERAFSLAETVAIVQRLASALDAAHGMGVVHRDLKPENVLIGDSGEPLLSDFGISAIVDPAGTTAPAHTSTRFVTLAHAAPEVLAGADYSPASDIYALASTSYQLLTGHPPFDPHDPRVASLILDQPAPAITRPDVPPAVAAVVLAALAKDPGQRPASAGAFAAALTQAAAPALSAAPGGSQGAAGLTTEPSSYRLTPTEAFGSPPASPAPPKPARRRRRAIFAVVGLALVLVLVAAGLRAGSRGQAVSRDLTLVGHTDSVWQAVFNPGGNLLATASDDRTVRLWDVTDGATVRTLVGTQGGVYGEAFSPDGRTLATANGDQTARLWDVHSGTLIRSFTDHADLRRVAFSPDGRILATASDDDTARLWNVSTGASIRTLTGHTGGLRGVAFSPDGRTLATASTDKTAQLWDVNTGASLRTFSGHTDWVRGVAFSPDGRTLATASDDRTVRLWDVNTGTTIRTLEHTDSVRAVAFSPDGRTLATASTDKIARLWDVTTGATLRSLAGHVRSLNGVAFSPDGRALATASDDNTARTWVLR